jgi:hypothetical protein
VKPNNAVTQYAIHNSVGSRASTQPERQEAIMSESPEITHLSWGHLEVEGKRRFKDAKLYPGGAREWDWRETGTDHEPGIQPADVAELLEHGAQEVVLSRGINERLQVMPQTLEMLAERGIAVHVMQTEKAVEKYNQLRQTTPVGGLFHSTC